MTTTNKSADTDLDALLPCPWCGGKPSVCEDDSYGACSIICGSCDTGPDGAHRKKEELAEAIKVWNTRARLSPATHADDEALDALEREIELDDEPGGALLVRAGDAISDLRHRLAELRARAEAAEKRWADAEHLIGPSTTANNEVVRIFADMKARAETAERALAECRNLVSRALRRMSRGENSMSILTQLAQEAEALKTKEPRDA